MTSFSLRAVKLRSGEQYREEKAVALTPLDFGGQRYVPIPETVPTELTIGRASTGRTFRLRFAARIHGPCMRCLTDAVVDLPIDASEYQANDPAGADELRTPYVVDDVLQLSAWARDAIALALPDKILCRADCAGLCPECGRDLNREPHEHGVVEPDSRWAALAELRDRL